MHLRLTALALVHLFSLYGITHAQLPRRLEQCLPYPTLAQEIRIRQEETSALEPESVPAPRVVIASIHLAPPTHVPESVRNRIVGSIKSSQHPDDAKMDWLEELQDVGIRGILQDSGYFKAKVKVDARLLDRNERRSRYALTLHIEEGWQYRLGNVRFEAADPDKSVLAFSASELRQRVHMRPGDLFSIVEVRSSIEEISKLYGGKGYIDMTPEPIIQNADGRGPLDLVIKINEGKQYRVGRVDFLGLDENSQNQLKAQLQPGEPFNKALVDQLLKRNESLLPVDASWQDVHLTRNARQGAVDLSFDFYSCPQWSAASASSR